MTSRKYKTVKQPTLHSWRRLIVWLRNGLLLLLAALALLLLFVGLEKWRRKQEAFDRLGRDPMMSKTILNLKLIEQEIRVDDVLFNWKPSSPKIVNQFEAKGDQREVFDQLIELAKENGWRDFSFYNGNDGDLRFSAKKAYSQLTIRVGTPKKNDFRVYISNK